MAFTKLAQWYNEVEQAGFKFFNKVSRTIQNHYTTILNFFDNRSTNASAESFNAKIKAFRAQFRGVTNIDSSCSGYPISMLEKTIPPEIQTDPRMPSGRSSQLS